MSCFKRKVIVHFHFFKNAGSTVDHIFRKNFPNSFHSLDSPDRSSKVTSKEGIEYILRNRKLQVLTSHQLLYPLPECNGLSIYSMFFLRHPIDRINSVYQYNRVREDTSSDSPVKQLSFKNFIEWRMGNNIKGIKDFHVRRLTKNVNIIDLTEKELSAAIDILQNSNFFGIVERFDDSLTLMKNYLRHDFPKIDYSYVVQNRSSKIDSLENRLINIKEQLGAELYEKLLALNRLDLELYNYALKLFNDRINI